MKRAAGFGWLALVSLAAFGHPAGLAAQAAACAAEIRPPTLPERPSTPPDTAGRGTVYWSWAHAFEREHRGVGVLSPTVRPDGTAPGYDWLPEVSLPLFGRPGDAEPTAWMHLGWWVAPGSSDAPRRLTYRGMMETSYEEASLVVVEARDDGWLNVWVDIGPIARAATHGLMWTHRCLLDLGSTPLALTLWADRFVGPGAPALSFLGSARHALRTAPHTEADTIAWLEEDDEVVIEELAGDWARVRASRPGRYLVACEGGEWDGEELAGWVRWRDGASGTWLWYPTRGC